MNWTETKKVLMAMGVGAERLPEKWQPRIDLSYADLRGCFLAGTYLTDADLSGADMTGADLRGADLSDADLRGANLRDADLSGANLRGTYLTDADLRGTNLSEADLTGANLRGTYLTGANLTGVKDIIGFYPGRHFGFFQPSSGYLKIGCIGMPAEEWIGRYEDIGREHEYTTREIARYGAMIRLCVEWQGSHAAKENELL